MTDPNAPHGESAPDEGGANDDALAIFAEDAFQEYDEQPLIPTPPPRRERPRQSPADSDAIPNGVPAGAPDAAPSATMPVDDSTVAMSVDELTARMPRSEVTAPAPIDGGASPFGAPLLPSRHVADASAVSAHADAGGGGGAAHGGSGGGIPRHQRILLWTAIGLVAVLALVTLFFLGSRLGQPQEPAAAPVPSQTLAPEVVEPAEPEPVGPAALGPADWNELRGGECLEPYTNPWAEEFTVVDCALPHRAQVLSRATFPGVDEATPYPTAAVLQAQINVLCSDPAVIDLGVAGAYSDIQIDGSYAVTAEQWQDGLHDYTCFVSRASGEPIAESLVPAA